MVGLARMWGQVFNLHGKRSLCWEPQVENLRPRLPHNVGAGLQPAQEAHPASKHRRLKTCGHFNPCGHFHNGGHFQISGRAWGACGPDQKFPTFMFM
jgi:hypothetical protein